MRRSAVSFDSSNMHLTFACRLLREYVTQRQRCVVFVFRCSKQNGSYLALAKVFVANGSERDLRTTMP
jgi:hypothetical protein